MGKALRAKRRQAKRQRIQRKKTACSYERVMRFANAASESRVVVATETPVERFDESRNTVIREVLLMEGVSFRSGKKQIPIVDSHDDSTVRNIYGSVRDLAVDRAAGELGGVPVFASDEDSQTIAKRVEEGHITDFSITALPLEGIFVSAGETYTTSRGVTIEGPANIITRWEPHNASICATGADENSTVRRSYTDLKRKKVIRMEPAMLAGLGVPDGMEDPNEIIAFLAGKSQASAMPMAEPVVENMEGEDSTPMEEEPIENMESSEDTEKVESMSDEQKQEMQRSVRAEAVQQERKRVAEIQEACTLAKLERSYADELVSSGVDIHQAREKIIQRMAAGSQAVGQTGSHESQPQVTESSDDKFFEAARDGLLQRCFQSAGIKRAAVERPAAGSQDFRNARLSRMAEDFLVRRGVNVRNMASKDIALVAMGHPGACNRLRIERSDPAFHSSGSFPNLLLDAANKTLLAGYEEAPYTWVRWARQAPSVDDFKNINRVRFSEMGSPQMVPENDDYPEAKTSDQKESYKVEKYGNLFTVTWETVVNDDLDAISRVPAMQGTACRRKQNALVYSVLTSNANLSDGGALFNSTAQTTAGGHANLASSGADISVTTLNAAFNSMMTKKGIGTDGTDSDAILGIQPAYLIVPSAISGSAMQFTASIADPSAGGSNAGNSNTNNPYGPNGERGGLQLIVEPLLDANSATAWYLAAEANQVDTVEVTFLAGEESPVLESDWNMKKDVYEYKVRQTMAAAPIDFRGLYKNPGA